MAIIKKNIVAVIAFFAALVTVFIVPPDKAYLGYFDLKTLTCLFCVLAVVCALKNIRFFYLLARNPNRYDAAGTESGVVSRAAAWLQQHFSEDVTLTELARMTAVSPEHLSRLFRKETGVGFREYRNLLRLQKAEQLLKQRTGASVAEIAAECGFSDSNYFSVAFKKVYGISPKQVQK
jgi:AraC-like DNA-binding protein